MLLRTIALVGLVSANALTATRNLEIYWIDAEGGAATLIVTPSGQSMLVDTANRTPDDRDAKRIYAATRSAGLKKIDILLTTHYHSDHVGAGEALSKMIPIDMFMDHGESVELDRPRGVELYNKYVELSKGKRKILKPGDRIPLDGVNVTVVSADGRVIPRPINGGGSNEALCQDFHEKAPETDTENNESVGFLLSYGKFKFLSLGDLPWNYENALACPQNLVGKVDLYQTTHHGLDRSGAPQLVLAINPRVVVMNNGPRKGGPPSTFETLRKSADLLDIWQGHLALATPKETNTSEPMIANLGPTDGCEGHAIKASVAPDGKYTLTNARNGFSKTYASR